MSARPSTIVPPKQRKLPIVISVVTAAMLVATSAAAAGVISYQEVPLSQAEIVGNWVVDRSVPSGGYESTSFEGRDNVLEMRVDPDNRSELGSFYHTEGLLRQTAGATALRADLYIDPAWEGQDIRAGLWGVGHDQAGARTAFPIIEYHQASGDSEWRVWDSEHGVWLPHPASTGYGEWVTLEVVLDPDVDSFVTSVDGVSAMLPTLGSVVLGEVIVNMFNYGPGTPAYQVHVSDFAMGIAFATPSDKNDCRQGGYTDFGYANQGLCIAGIVSDR